MSSIIRRPSDVESCVRDWRRADQSIGFVPTMGALHEGHCSLVRAAASECDRTVVSIFVNPMQFDRPDDLASYPRTESDDTAALASLGVDVIYLPSVADLYPKSFATYVDQTGLGAVLCGATRPGHFRGVLTVVAKLFNLVAPDRAYFGRKDFQQATMIRRMARDLDFGIDVRVLPTVRDEDGLAMSSRNRLLTAADRERARCLPLALTAAVSAFASGCRSVAALTGDVRRSLEVGGATRIDYVTLVDGDALEPRTADALPDDVLAVAVFFGRVRLIDNVRIGGDPS